MTYRYLTTPIYYASGNPHLGHAYTTILTDALVRYHRLRGRSTKFTTGMDEHGLKIERAAQKQGQEPQEFVDDLAVKFRSMIDELGNQPSDFIRTTENRHKETVLSLWKRLEERGDIYKGAYEGLYCVDCEEFYQDTELGEEKVCPTHKTPLENFKEESYFFRMSKYQKTLMDHIEANPDFIVPQKRKNEVLGFLKNQDLKDLSISRSSFTWGVPVPEDDKHVMYVWVDALTNYVSSLGGFEEDDFKNYWPEAAHVIGKDILRFHAVYWPCLLLAAGFPLPRSIVVHGWWTVHSQKISKSNPATRVDPLVLKNDLTADGVRFQLLKQMTLGNDGDLVFESFIQSVNAGLANNLGNLLNRTVQMSKKYLQFEIPAQSAESTLELDQEIQSKTLACLKVVEENMERYNTAGALDAVLALASDLNQYIETCAPWELAKDESNKERLGTMFAYLTESMRWVANLLSPFVPTVAQGMLTQLGQSEPEWPTEFALTAKTLSKGKILFKRIDEEAAEEMVSRWVS